MTTRRLVGLVVRQNTPGCHFQTKRNPFNDRVFSPAQTPHTGQILDLKFPSGYTPGARDAERERRLPHTPTIPPLAVHVLVVRNFCVFS